MADHVRPRAAIDADRAAGPRRARWRSSACACPPISSCCRARSSRVDGTLRVHLAGDLARGRGDRDDRRRPPASRSSTATRWCATSCWRCCRTSAACPSASTASSRSPARGELRMRTVVGRGQPSHPSHVRQPHPALGDRRGVPLRVGDPARRRPTPGPPSPIGDGLFEMLRLRRTARRHRAAAPGRRRGRSGRDDVMSANDLGHLSAPPDVRPAMPAARHSWTAPPGERYYRHPGDVVRLVVLGLRHGAARRARLGRHGDDRRGDERPRRGRGPASRRRSASSSSALCRSGAIVVPVVVVALLVVAAPLAAPRVRRARRARRRGGRAAARHRRSTSAAALPAAITSGTWVASTRFPSLAYLGGVAAAVTVGKPWLSRPWRRAADIAVAVLRPRDGLAGTAGVPELLLAVAAGGRSASALLVVVGAPEPAAEPERSVAPCATPASTSPR